MNRNLIKKYIDEQTVKIVSSIDVANNKLTYDKIHQGRTINEIPGDEEMSRAFILTRLVNELGYSADRIEIEHEYTAGRPHTNTSRIDIIVRDSHGDAFLFIEVKSPEEYASIDKDKTIEEQLYKVSFMENAEGHSVKYLVLYTTSEAGSKVSDECMIIDTDEYPTFADWESDRNCTNDLPTGVFRSLNCECSPKNDKCTPPLKMHPISAVGCILSKIRVIAQTVQIRTLSRLAKGSDLSFISAIRISIPSKTRLSFIRFSLLKRLATAFCVNNTSNARRRI